MLGKIYRLLIACLAAVPIQLYVMPVLLQYVYMPSSYGQIIMYIMIAIVIYEFLVTYKKWKKWDWHILAGIYYITLIYILFARPDMGYSLYELDPFQLVNSIRYGSYDEWIIALFNILIFIPMPIMNHYYFKKDLKVLFSCVSIGFLIELIQAISRRGVFDIGDIILYGVGILIGYIIEKRL